MKEILALGVQVYYELGSVNNSQKSCAKSQKTVDSQGAPPRQVFLDYPKSKENDTKAKALGAKFDKEQKAWYMMSDNPYLQPFQKEMSQQADANKAIEKSSKKDILGNKVENTPTQTRKSTPKL